MIPRLRKECESLRRELDALSARQEQRVAFFELLPSPCVTFDVLGIIRETNLAFAFMIGVERDSLPGQPFCDLLATGEASAFQAHLRSNVPHGSQIGSTLSLVGHGGRLLPVLMESVWIDPAADGTGLFLATLKDATDRQRIEESLRVERDFNSALLQTSGALIIVLDPRGHIVRFNHACETVSGYATHEVMGRPFWEMLLPAEQIERMRGYFQNPSMQHVAARYETHWLTKSGKLRLISWMNTVLTGPDGSLRAIIGSGLDITEQRQLESEVLEIADREQRRIGADLHDGLGQQLTAISLLCQDIQADLADQPAAQTRLGDLGALLRQAIRHTRILSQGLASFYPEDASLGQILAELAETTNAIGPAQCLFTCHCSFEGIDPQITNHLSQIAREAVNNALRHSGADRIEIELHCSGDSVNLHISDNGTGFQEANRTAKGMGLAVMRYRTNLLRGTINITSRPGNGVAIDCVVHLKP
jgi:PAS domain S-box-containing protein